MNETLSVLKFSGLSFSRFGVAENNVLRSEDRLSYSISLNLMDKTLLPGEMKWRLIANLRGVPEELTPSSRQDIPI